MPEAAVTTSNNDNDDDGPRDQQRIAVCTTTTQQQSSTPFYHDYRGEALAPMVRASTLPLRALALRYGADFTYTEELVDRSIGDTLRVENTRLGTVDYVKDTAKLAPKVIRRLTREGGPPLLLRIDPRLERGRLVCQLGTGEPELALQAALHVHRDVSSIDLNMGCPKKFSVSGGMGSALLQDPERASRILRKLSTNVPCPVSCKIRLLPTTTATMDLLTALIERGRACAVAIHGRRVGHGEIQPAQWDDLAEVVELAKAKWPTTRILVNGDFYTRRSWYDFRDRTGADGVLWARPALYNMSMFRKPTAVSPTTTDTSGISYGYTSPLLLDRVTVIQEYLGQALRYETHYKNVKYVIAEMMNTRRTPSPIVPHLVSPQEYFKEQTIGATSACHDMDSLCQLWKVDRTAARTNKTPLVTAPEGEHRYDDSYLLRMEQGSKTITTPADHSTEPSPPAAKRPRTEKVPSRSG